MGTLPQISLTVGVLLQFSLTVGVLPQFSITVGVLPYLSEGGQNTHNEWSWKAVEGRGRRGMGGVVGGDRGWAEMVGVQTPTVK